MHNVVSGGFKVGDSVSFHLGGATVEGLIVEDRGPLAAGGRRLYRILVSFPPEEMISFEMPETELALHAARMALFTEMANRVIEIWWRMPLGGPLDRVSGFQALERAVFDACRKVAEEVKSEGTRIATDIGLSKDPIPSPLAKAIATAQEQALRVGKHARDGGLDGLHEEIERALWHAATAELERLLRVANDLGWREFEASLRNAGQQDARYPLLALLAESPLELAR